ncbi:MAG: NUDIX hydrolase [Actinomycetota bacterium]|nr:NUDIX hydrolase [Actinomycetota bacterium]MDQ3720597.1 NUDIX hydrolase [Actinomycetota bacterium]
MRADRPGPSEEPSDGDVAGVREAASVILLRDAPGGPEVLLVQRNPEQRLMGGAWVFPGGSLSEGDSDELATARRELSEEAGVGLPEHIELVRWSRWITPAQVEVRFDTHFFVARAAEGTEPEVDGAECVDFRWLRPRDALDAGTSQELTLLFPTIKHLEQLAEHDSVEEALQAAHERKVLPVEPRLVLEGGVAQVLMPGEAGYDEAAAR